MDLKMEAEVDDDSADNLNEFGDDDQKLNRYNALTLAERIAVLEEHEKNKSITSTSLAEMFGCSKTQILFILKHKKEYLEEWNKNRNPQRIRRSISPHVLTLGIMLFEYIWRLRHYPIEVTDDNLKCVAKAFAEMIRFRNFKPSKRWLERFKNCYRLNGSKLMTSSVITDSKKEKSLKLDSIFKDLQKEFKLKNVTITDLNEEHLIELKIIRSSKLMASLRIDPRAKFRRRPNFSSSNISQSLIMDFQNTTKSKINTEEDDDDDKEDDHVQYVEVLTDQYETESSNKSPFVDNFNSPNIQNIKIEETNNEDDNEIKTYRKALDHLQKVLDFALIKEDYRAIGLINHLEIHFKEKLKENNEE